MSLDFVVMCVLWLVVTHTVIYLIGYAVGENNTRKKLLNRDEGDYHE